MKPARRRSSPTRATRKETPDPLQAEAGPGEDFAPLALAAPGAAAPSPGVKAALLARIRASRTPTVAAPGPVQEGWRFESAHDERGWRGGVIPGVRFKTLAVDEPRDVVSVLVEIAPGARFPDHLHDAGADDGIVISGDVITGGRLLKAGDYYFAAEGTRHVDTVSPSGCVALVTLTARAWNKWRAALLR